MQEKIKVRGLVRIAGWIFVVWGVLAAGAGFYHAFWAEPEANEFSRHSWEFISKEQWFRWSAFEVVYGMACVLAGLLCWEYAKRLPEWIARDKPEPDRILS